MAKAVSPKAARSGKPTTTSKGGGLTRQQRTARLRKQQGYGTIQLVPGGLRITCRASDGFVNVAEILAAEAEQRGGKPKRLQSWMRLPTTAPFLAAVAEALGPNEPGSSDGLIERGAGQEPWAHPEVACEVAGWLSPLLRVAINRLWLDTVNGKRRPSPPRPLDPDTAAVVQGRKDAHQLLAEVAVQYGVPPQYLHDAKTIGLTGKQPRHWAKQFGTDDWLAHTSPEHQRLHQLAALGAAHACRALPEGATKRHHIAAARGAGAHVQLMAKALSQPWEPAYDGPQFSPARLHRHLLLAAAEQPDTCGVLRPSGEAA